MLLSLVLVFNAPKISHAIEGVIWNSREENFKPIFSVSSFLSEKNERARIIRDLENHNFQKARVTVAFFQEKNLVSFNDNDTEITGVCGDLWTILSDYLNFTLVPVRQEDRRFGAKLKNGSFDGLLGLIEQNKALIIPRTGLFTNRLSLLEYTLPMWTVRYYLYIKPEWKHDESWMFHLFTTKVWCAIVLSLLILCVVGYLYDKYIVNQKETPVKHRSNFQDHLLYTVALASSQGSHPAEYNYRSKVVYITTSMFSWLILIAFSSHTIFLMMNKKYFLPFTGLRSLIQKSNYEVTTFTGSMVREDFDALVSRYFIRSSDAARVLYASNSYEIYQKVCFSKQKFAAFEPEDLYKTNGKYHCRLVPTQHPYFDTWIASAVKRGFRYKRSFDNGILKLAETGLLDGIKDRWMNWKLTESEEVPFQSIDINQVYMIFAILFIGFLLSILLLLVEYVTFFRSKICEICMEKCPFKRQVKEKIWKRK